VTSHKLNTSERYTVIMFSYNTGYSRMFMQAFTIQHEMLSFIFLDLT